MKNVQPQGIVLAPMNSAIFLVGTIRTGSEDAVRDVLGDLGGMTRGVGFRAPGDHLASVAGISSSAWDRLYSGPRPQQLHTLPALSGAVHQAPSTPGDLLFHLRAMRPDLCFELARQLMTRLQDHLDIEMEIHGFRYFDERDLLGFVDGTENPVDGEAVETVLVGEEDPDFRGSSYVVIQKYLHDLPAWHGISTEAQEDAIGRSKLEDIEMPDDKKPHNSHVHLNTITDDDGNQLKIVRENMAFGEVGSGEYGTLFCGYAKDPRITERMLHNMFIGQPEGTYDRILDFSTAVTGTLFFVPTVDFLENPPAAPDQGGHCFGGVSAVVGVPPMKSSQ